MYNVDVEICLQMLYLSIYTRFRKTKPRKMFSSHESTKKSFDFNEKGRNIAQEMVCLCFPIISFYLFFTFLLLARILCKRKTWLRFSLFEFIFLQDFIMSFVFVLLQLDVRLIAISSSAEKKTKNETETQNNKKKYKNDREIKRKRKKII